MNGRIISESLLKMAVFANYNFEKWLIISTFVETKPQKDIWKR